jgi:hypothetical protein
MVTIEINKSRSSDKVYEIRMGDDYRFYCTCPAWRFSKPDPETGAKTCRHMNAFASRAHR